MVKQFTRNLKSNPWSPCRNEALSPPAEFEHDMDSESANLTEDIAVDGRMSEGVADTETTPSISATALPAHSDLNVPDRQT